jgi:hypothetical protein
MIVRASLLSTAYLQLERLLTDSNPREGGSGCGAPMLFSIGADRAVG